MKLKRESRLMPDEMHLRWVNFNNSAQARTQESGVFFPYQKLLATVRAILAK